jgi:predicted P-loop ATPase
LISDPTGNRRIVPVNVFGIDQDAYNAIDKKQLLIEAYCLYMAGFVWQLNKKDIQLLGDNTDEFQMSISEAELLMQYFKPGEDFMTATNIKVILEKHTQQRISLDRLGKELKRLGYEQVHKKIGSGTSRMWKVKCIINNNESRPPDDIDEDNLPF